MSTPSVSTEQLEDTVRALRQCSHHLHSLRAQARAEAKSSRAYYERAVEWAAALESDALPSQLHTVTPSAVEVMAGQLELALCQHLQERSVQFAAEKHRLEVLHEYNLRELIAHAPRAEPPNEEDEKELVQIEALEAEEQRLQELQAELSARVQSLQRRCEASEKALARKEEETAVMQAYVVDRPSEVLDFAKYLLHPQGDA